MFGYTMILTYVNMVFFLFSPHVWQLKTSKIIFIKKNISHFSDIVPVKRRLLLRSGHKKSRAFYAS
jgi:hypothetical protein